jgi:NMD protein affecting ribosome stability and mRNA decay
MTTEIHVSVCKHCSNPVLRVGKGKWWHAELEAHTREALLDTVPQTSAITRMLIEVISNAKHPAQVANHLQKLLDEGVLSKDDVMFLTQVDIPINNRSCKAASYERVDAATYMLNPWGKKNATPTKGRVVTL